MEKAKALRLFKRFLAVLIVSAGLGFAFDARSQGFTLIRDAEIEHTIRVYSTPLFQAAGLSPQSIDVYLIQDKTLNAFVTGGSKMFLNTGLLMRADNPSQVIGVIAHETGHIAGGHLVGRIEELKTAQWKALAATLLGIGAAVATGQGAAAGAATSGGYDVAVKGLLSYTRSQEQSADQAAVTYLRGTEQSPEGLLEFMEILGDQEALLSSSQDPYLRSHPLTRDRVSFLEQAVRESPYTGVPSAPELVEMHERMRAKLIGFLEPPRSVNRRYPPEDQSIPARYAHSISKFRSGYVDQSLDLIDGLIAERPNDPYFNELKGQILLENGRVAEALPAYQKAVDILPEEPQLRLRLAETQTQLNTPEQDKAALENISRVLAHEPNNATAWRLAAIAHGRLGDKGMTTLSLAEMNFARGNWGEAVGQAERAQKILPENSPAWVRASDLSQIARQQVQRARDRQ